MLAFSILSCNLCTATVCIACQIVDRAQTLSPPSFASSFFFSRLQYMPTIGDMYVKDIEVDGMPKHIEIDDTAGQEAYADLKKEKMSTGDVSVQRRQ